MRSQLGHTGSMVSFFSQRRPGWQLSVLDVSHLGPTLSSEIVMMKSRQVPTMVSKAEFPIQDG